MAFDRDSFIASGDAEASGIQGLIEGVQAFQTGHHVRHQELFKDLKEGQRPDALFVTCSDSRIDPNLVTQTRPGGLFILRNAGAIIPPYGAANGGEGATVEYAVLALNVEHIIVCGHTHCGAMAGLCHPESLAEMGSVAKWLTHAEATRLIVKENHPNLQGEHLVAQAARENVLIQIENLQTHPAVALRRAQGRLELHGWMYDFETGNVDTFDPVDKTWRALTDPSDSVSKYHRAGAV